MNATPPEPDVPAPVLPVQDFPAQFFPVQGDMGTAARQPGSASAGQPGSASARQSLVRRLPVWQIVISLIKPVLWTAAAVIILVGGVLELTIDNVPGAVVCVIVGGLSVWFAYRSGKRWARRG